jgi:hypothetical protein
LVETRHDLWNDARALSCVGASLRLTRHICGKRLDAARFTPPPSRVRMRGLIV